MKNLVMSLALLGSIFFVISCDDEDPTETIIDSSMPMGSFSAASTGSIMGQNDTGTEGTAELGTDADGVQFLRLGSDFMTNLGTGTVTVFLSTSETYSADPMNGNPDLLLVGAIKSNGEQYFKIAPKADAKFDHVIFWCATAGIPFGYAAIQ